MPARVLRDGLLDSPRWHAVSHEAARFFVALVLLADDFGLLNLQPIYIGRHAFAKRPSDARLDKLIAELVGVDLLRIYWSGDQENPVRFGFLPRFRQKLRQMKARHPLPPRALYEDDLDASAKFMEHKGLFAKMSASRLQAVDNPAAEVKGNEVKRSDLEVEVDSETKRKEVDLEVPLPLVAGAAASPTDAQTATPSFLVSERQPQTPTRGNGNGANHGNADSPQPTASTEKNPQSIPEWADFLGITRQVNEHPGNFQLRVMHEVSKWRANR